MYIKSPSVLLIYIPSFIFTIIFFIYVLIFASILASKGGFDENDLKVNFNNSYLEVINKINLSLFGFLAYILISYILYFWASFDSWSDYGKLLIVKKILLIMIEFLYICYDILIIIKLSLSYKIIKDKTTWIMICDFILIILIFLYVLSLAFLIYLYFKEAGKMVGIKEKALILNKFRGMKINDYILPDNFIKMSDYDKRKFTLNNINVYKTNISEENKKLISEINKFRKENNVDKLNYSEKINFNELIFEKLSEPNFYEDENIFKFSNESYLLKYPSNDFVKKFNDKQKNICEILLNLYLDKIIIIEKNNNQFIFLSKLHKKNCNTIYNENQSEYTELYFG